MLFQFLTQSSSASLRLVQLVNWSEYHLSVAYCLHTFTFAGRVKSNFFAYTEHAHCLLFVFFRFVLCTLSRATSNVLVVKLLPFMLSHTEAKGVIWLKLSTLTSNSTPAEVISTGVSGGLSPLKVIPRGPEK